MHNLTVDAAVRARQEMMLRLFARAPIKQAFGMELSYDGEGRALFDMPYNPALDHFLGGIHGGIIATLLDNAGWFTAATCYDTWVATVELQVRLLVAVEQVGLHAAGSLLKVGKRFAVGEMQVRTADGRLVAVGSGTFAVTSAPLEDRISGRSIKPATR